MWDHDKNIYEERNKTPICNQKIKKRKSEKVEIFFCNFFWAKRKKMSEDTIKSFIADGLLQEIVAKVIKYFLEVWT